MEEKWKIYLEDRRRSRRFTKKLFHRRTGKTHPLLSVYHWKWKTENQMPRPFKDFSPRSCWSSRWPWEQQSIEWICTGRLGSRLVSLLSEGTALGEPGLASGRLAQDGLATSAHYYRLRVAEHGGTASSTTKIRRRRRGHLGVRFREVG